MKVFMVGGTGLLGSETARILIEREHEVTTVALSPLPEGAELSEAMEITLGNILEMTDDEILEKLAGCEGFVYAAGVDERVEAPAPVYDTYHKYNIEPVNRLLKLCKTAGIRHAAVCGSYFSWFAKERPEMNLAMIHPYIRSRLDQEAVALSYADEDFSVGILELPYIFGVQKGRKPVWMFLADMIRSAKGTTYYAKGGSAMITVRQAGEAIAGALERTEGGKCWPVGWNDLTWNEMLLIGHKALGREHQKIRNLPKWMFSLGLRAVRIDQKRRGIDGGLYLPKLADIQYSYFYIDKQLGSVPLGVTDDDIEKAITESFELCAEILDGKSDAIDMKGE